MQQFDAAFRRSHLWFLGVGAPAVFIAVLQLWAHGVRDGDVPIRELLGILALAELLPVLALAWMLCSVAAYSVVPGRIVVHRVIGDREHSLAPATDQLPRREGSAITLGTRRGPIRVYAEDPARCLAALRAAAAAAACTEVAAPDAAR